MSNCVAIIQGRMSSSRLPGKVLLDIGGKPMLQRVIERVGQSTRVDKIVVATSNDPSDDPIEKWCLENKVACHRGSLHDVLDRFHGAAIAFNATTIVRVTADCPFIDPVLIDETIQLLERPINGHSIDFAANRLPPPYHRTFPIGLDVEVCTMHALQKAWKDSSELFHREHVMPYLYEDTPLVDIADGNQWGISKAGFNIAVLNAKVDEGEKRWTVDTPEDLAFARVLVPLLPNELHFDWMDMIEITRQHPEIASINSEVKHKTMKDVDERAK